MSIIAENTPIIGRLLKKYRTEEKIKVLELCYGICNKTSLYRIEKGEISASVYLIRSLFSRLHKKVPDNLIPITLKQYKRLEIEKKIEFFICDNRNTEIQSLLHEYKKDGNLNKFEKQYALMIQGIIISADINKLEDALLIYEKALKITLPNFNLQSDEINYNLLTDIELSLINNIAHAEYYIFTKNKKDFSLKNKAFKRIIFLKEYYEKYIENYKSLYNYSVIIFNLTNWTGLEGNIKEALKLSEYGYKITSTNLIYKAEHLFNIAYSHASLGEISLAKKYFNHAFTLFEFTGQKKELENLKKEIKCCFNI